MSNASTIATEGLSMEYRILRGLAALSIAVICLPQSSLAQQCEYDRFGRNSFQVAMAAPMTLDDHIFSRELNVFEVDPTYFGQMPDAIVLTAPTLGKLVERGSVIGLDEHYDSFEPFLSETQFLRVGDTAYALPLFASSRVWVVRKDIADEIGFDYSASYTSIFEFLENARYHGYGLGLDYGEEGALAADIFSVFNGLSGTGLTIDLTFGSDTGRQALEAIQNLAGTDGVVTGSVGEIMEGFEQGRFVAISMWASSVDRYFDMIAHTGHSVVIAPPVLLPDQRPSTQLFWTGVAFTGSLSPDEMRFVYCSLQATFAPSNQDPRDRFPLQWTQEGLAWSLGGEGVISALGRGASLPPTDPAVWILNERLGQLAKSAILNGYEPLDALPDELDDLLNEYVNRYGIPDCMRNRTCSTLIPESWIWKTGNGSCSSSACSSGQYCCNGKCQNTPCK
ncbi:MAG: hypothetical protein OXF56_07670 [Rhodobacteraceae bacterium]|nr:hypothetical protein [Paracoccaceae bacterium]